VSAAEAPGLYRLDIADGVFASGAWSAVVSIRDAAANDVAQTDMEFQLVAYDVTDGVRLGLTALPNAGADAAGGLPISDAGGLDLDTKLANTNEVTATRMGALTDWIDGGRLDLILDDILTDTAVIGALGAGLTAIPWNAAWDAEVQSECTDALNAYDPPTNAEMVARTLEAAAYFDPAADTVAHVTLVDTTTTNTDMVAEAPTPNQVRAAILSDDTPFAGANVDAAISTRSSHSAADVWEVVIENALKAKHLLSCFLAYIANRRSGGGTVTLSYRNNANSVNRITQTVNENGEVSASTINVSDIP